MRPELLQKLQETLENPGFYRALTPEEQAELFLAIVEKKEEPKEDKPLIAFGGVSEKRVRQIIEENPGGGEGVTDHGALTGLADDDHTQYLNNTRGDTRYYTKSQVDTSLSGKADTSHTHTKSQITDFSDADYADAVHGHVIADTTGLQTALDGKAATSHTHIIADTTGLQTALDGKAASVHTHIIGDVTGLQTALNTKLETVLAADVDSGAATDGYVLTADGAGNAAWEASPSGVTDHGALTGLADDDHTQYHTDARGDARYSLLSHTHTGVYEPADATILKDADIGVTVQGYSAVLAATTASFTTADETKLDGIAAGAEANVNADWNAVSGDAQILNKPTISGTNTGDQTSIVGITGSKAQFNTAVTDGDIMYVGDAPTAHTHAIADTTGLQTALDNKLDDTQFVGLTKITVGTSAPGSPTTGDLWVDTN